MIIPGPGDPDLPFSFRLAKAMYALRDSGRGSYFLYNLLERTGRLSRAGRFSYFGNKLLVPLRVPETLFVKDFTLFHGLREINFANEINRTLDKFTLIDCGVYFGQVSMRIAHLCPGIENVIAIDPNQESCEITDANLASTGIPFRVFNVALSDRPGRGTLVFPDGIKEPDSAYIDVSENGAIEIQTVDDLLKKAGIEISGKDFALKLDVEGEEIATISGAWNLISNARNICLFMELHPEVLNRIGHTAEHLLNEVSRIRPVNWYVADEPYRKIDPNQAVFDQIGERACDIIGVSN